MGGQRAQRQRSSERARGRRVRLSLLVSGLRWRLRSSLAMFAVAAFGAGIGAFGPTYLHSADQVVLNGTLAGAPPGADGLSVIATSGHPPVSRLVEASRRAPEPVGAKRWWGAPIQTQFAGFTTIPPVVGPSTARRTFVPYNGTRPFRGTLVSRTGACAHLQIVAGTCPRGDGVIVSTRTAQILGLHVGLPFYVSFLRNGPSRPLVVSGIYLAGNPAGRFWWGENYFPFYSPAPSIPGVPNEYEVDDTFATAAAVRALAPASHITPLVQLPLRQGSVSVDEVASLRQAVTSYQASSLQNGIRVGTGLLTELTKAGVVEHTAATIVAVIGLELALLAVFVLYFVASRTAAEREPDVRLAELRGFRPRTTIGVALAEPVAVVAVAVPVGFLAAWLVAGLVAPAAFGQGIGASPTPLAVYAAVASGAVGILAAALGTRRALVAGVDPASGASVGAGAPSRWSVLGPVAVVVLAAAAFFELVTVGDSGSGGASSTDPLAAFAPGLLALALGVLTARLLPWALRATHRRTAGSRRVALALATRLVARRREFAAQVTLVAVAVGLATFAVSGWAIAGRNRDVRTQYGVGAAKVLRVSVAQGTTFLSDVQAADPSGRHAMAAVVEEAHDGTTLAVDARRLPAVVQWPSGMGLSAGQVARRLVPAHLAPQVLVEGTAVRVTASASGDVQPRPTLSMEFININTAGIQQVTFGPLLPGLHTYTAPTSLVCPEGCRLAELAVTWSPPETFSTGKTSSPAVSLDVRSIAERTKAGAWVRIKAGLHDAARWTSPSGDVALRSSAGGLDGRFRLNAFGSSATIGPADLPDALPVVVTPQSASQASGRRGPLVVGLDGATIAGRTVGEIPALPGVGAGAELADLSTAELLLTGPVRNDIPEVWLSQNAPPVILRSLRSHGVTVLSTQTVAAAEHAQAHSGVSLAYLLYLVSAGAAGVLVVAATGFAVAAGARRRQTELAALRAVGVSPATLRRTVWVEQALVLGSGLVVGALAGLVAAGVALRSVPEFVSRAAGPPLELGLPPLVLAVTVAALVVALAGATVWGASVVVRGARIDRLSAGQA